MPSTLKILMKIAFSCGASSKFRRCFIKNRAPVRSILKIPSIFHSKSRSRAEHPENAEENCAPPTEHPQNSVGISFKIALPCGACILKMLKKIAPPCGASSKFRRYIRSKSRSRAEHPKNFAAKSEHPQDFVVASSKIAFPCGAS